MPQARITRWPECTSAGNGEGPTLSLGEAVAGGRRDPEEPDYEFLHSLSKCPLRAPLGPQDPDRRAAGFRCYA